jgi:hypothetical protein
MFDFLVVLISFIVSIDSPDNAQATSLNPFPKITDKCEECAVFHPNPPSQVVLTPICLAIFRTHSRSRRHFVSYLLLSQTNKGTTPNIYLSWIFNLHARLAGGSHAKVLPRFDIPCTSFVIISYNTLRRAWGWTWWRGWGIASRHIARSINWRGCVIWRMSPSSGDFAARP